MPLPNHGTPTAQLARVGAYSARLDLWLAARVSQGPDGSTRLAAHEHARVEHVFRHEPAGLAYVYASLLAPRASSAASRGASSAEMLDDVRAALRLGHIVAYLLPVQRAGVLARPETTPVEESPLILPREETDFIDVLLTNGFDHPFKDEPYELTLQGGKMLEGKLDGQGRLKKKGVPFGRFTLEFPGLFGMTIIRDGQRLRDRGRGSPDPLPPPPEPGREVAFVHSNDDDDDDDDDPSVEASMPDDSGVGFLESFDGPDGSEGDDHSELDVRDPVATADLDGMTGCEYHLAVLYCVSIRLVNAKTGEWVREPLPFRLKEAGGKQVSSGESRDGLIFQDDTAMGDFAVEIEGKSYDVVATPHAVLHDLVYIEIES